METPQETKSRRKGRAPGLFWQFFKFGCYTFGGGWPIVAQMQKEYVQKRGWLTEEELLDITSVGRSRARAERFEGPLPVEPVQRESKTATVSSLRADAVLAAMLRCSRGQAEALVRGGRLEINHVPVTSAHAAVYEGDVFTVRGMGRFKLEALGGKSRKDRLFIQYFQY